MLRREGQVQGDSADPTYTMGRSEGETQRLAKQAEFYAPITQRLLEEAGITVGARVLDIGTGAGDVAMLAARLVGPGGVVIGVDRDEAVLATARERAMAQGIANVTVLAGDFRTMDLPDDFDMVVGRLVLQYQADPVAALRAVAGHVHSGGIVAFEEADYQALQAYALSLKSSPLFQQIAAWCIAVFEHSGVPTSMGFGLYDAFRGAGLGEPTMTAYAPTGGPQDWAGFTFWADGFRSALPLVERFGIATVEEVGVETLAARLHAEVATTGVPIQALPHVTAWARKP